MGKIKLLGLTNNKVKRKYGIVSIGSWTFMCNSSVPIESIRFSKCQAHAYHRKAWVPPSPPPCPRSPAFIDTLSSCLSERWNPGILLQQFFFCFFFFKTKCSGVFFFFFSNQIYCNWSLHLAWLVQNTLRLTCMIVFPKVCTCYVCNVDGK